MLTTTKFIKVSQYLLSLNILIKFKDEAGTALSISEYKVFSLLKLRAALMLYHVSLNKFYETWLQLP